MAKKYVLTEGLTTYATLSQVFRAGVEYTEDQVELVKDDKDDEGNPYFEEADEDSPKAGKGRVVINTKKGAKAPKDADDESKADDKGPAGGADGKTVTV